MEKQALIAGVIFSCVACALVFSIPYIHSHPVAKVLPIPYKMSPFRHNVGWYALEKVLKEAGYDETKDFLFADKYQTVSILSFYGPQQKRAYFFNIQGSRKNQFTFWPGVEQERQGQRGYFVVIENIPYLNNLELPERNMKELTPYFQKVHFIGLKPLFYVNGEIVKGVLLFECENYSGLLPPETTLY